MSNPVTISLGLEGANAISSALEGVVMKFAGLAAIVSTVNKAMNGVAESFNLGGKLKDLSDRTGETAGNVVILRRELDATGVSADSLGQITGLLQRSLAGVNEDGGATTATFQQLHLSMGRLRSLPLLEQIDAIGARLRELPTQADRADAAMKLFGRSGTQLLPLLLDGGALSQAKLEAGGLADEMDRNASAFDRVGDRVGALHLKLTEAYTIIAGRILPVAERLVEMLNSVSGANLANGLERGLQVGILVGGYAAFSKLSDKASLLFLDWATKPGAALSNSVGSALTGFTGALARILPLGLAAAISMQIGLALFQAQADAEAARLAMKSQAAGKFFTDRDAVNNLRSPEEADKMRASNAGRLADLDEEKKKLQALANLPGIAKPGTISEGKRGLSADEAARLEAIRIERNGIETINKVLADRERIEKKITDNKKADAELEAKQQASAKAAKERVELETELTAAQAARNQPEIDRLSRLIEEKKIKEDLKALEDKGVSTAGLSEAHLAARDALLAREIKEKNEAFALTTRQLEAEQTANLEQQKKLTLLEKERAYRKELTRPEDEPLIQARLKADATTLDRQNAQVALTTKLTAANTALAQVQAERGLITQSNLLDEATKLQRLNANTEEYRQKLAAVIALKLQERATAVGAADQARIDAEIGGLRDQGKSYGAGDTPPSRYQAVSNQYAGRGTPTQSFQGAGEAVAGGSMAFVNGIGSAANAAADAVNGTLNSSLAGTSRALNGLFSGSMTFKEGWESALMSVRQSFEQAAADMVAKMLWQATVERALTAMGVTTHAAGEVTKTGATATGAGTRGAIRLGETIFHGIQVALRTAAHVAGEIAKTAITVVQSGIRIVAILAESLVHVIKAAVQALSAFPIPFVGPFLGLAMAGGIIAAGASMMSKRAYGGDVEAGTPYVVGDGGRSEVFVPKTNGSIVPSLQAFALLSGAAADRLASRGASLSSTASASQATRATAAAPAPAAEAPAPRPLNLHNHFDRASVLKAMRDSDGEDWVIDVFNRNGHRLNIPPS